VSDENGAELVVDRVTKSFGGLRAVSDVSFTVPARSIFGLIGPNGAGKTTLFNLITGVTAPDSGSIRFGDVDLARLAPAAIASSGVARTFQNVRLFGELTVLENLLVAGGARGAGRGHARLLSALFRTARYEDGERAARSRAMELLRAFHLDGHAEARATSLAYGHQRRLEIARAMMLEPKLLLLDEPAAGLSTQEADDLEHQIRALRDRFALAIVLVEHNVRLVMRACERVHVLDHGETIASGAPAEVQRDARVVSAYLGDGA